MNHKCFEYFASVVADEVTHHKVAERLQHDYTSNTEAKEIITKMVATSPQPGLHSWKAIASYVCDQVACGWSDYEGTKRSVFQGSAEDALPLTEKGGVPVTHEPECKCDSKVLVSSGHETGCEYAEWKAIDTKRTFY